VRIEAASTDSFLMTESTISLGDVNSLLSLFGARDQHIKKIRAALGVEITHRDGKIRVAGSDQDVAKATKALEQLKSLVERRGSLADEEVSEVLRLVTDAELSEVQTKPITVLATGRKISARTPGQAKYIKAIRNHDLTFAVGPSGTGKTYLAVALAVEALKDERIRKIVLVRPAVEAGESLGFLPGDLQAKINPYLRPLLDALHEMMDYDQIKRQMEEDVIEVVPLAYMRGRTLNESFIILDEAQNTTPEQMKMFLTRIGFGSTAVITGDVTQVDLPRGQPSGLRQAVEILRHVDGISFNFFNARDVVRHALVQRIVGAYDDFDRKQPRDLRDS